MFKFLDNSVVVCWAKKMFELGQNMLVLSWIKLHIILTLKILDLEEKLLKIFSTWHDIDVNCQESLNCLEALGEFTHGAIMDWIPLKLVLLSKDLLIPIKDILRVLFKQVIDSNIEVLMPLHRLCIMEYILGKMAMLDIHVLEPIGILFTEELVEENLLQVDSLDIEECNHAVKIAFKAQVVVSIPARIVNIDLLLDDDLGISHLGDEI